ncbi:MAG: ATP-binding protein [Desulfurococcales archaeon ex4484_58]|nr:MAG: ATP-binding protein [Desulfurococcales archaeon ex4484_58]
MKATVLYTGGKDSTYALHWGFLQGFDIVVLSSLIPLYEDSMLYHKPKLELLELQSRSLNIPLEYIEIADPRYELEALYELLSRVKERYNIKVVFTGGVLSDYQRLNYMLVAEELGLKIFNPLWRFDQRRYLLELVSHNIEFILLSINTMGLPKYFLGKIITYNDALKIIEYSERYKFNPSFEGGEAETFVVYAPLFKYRILVDGEIVERGVYEYYYIIKNAVLKTDP